MSNFYTLKGYQIKEDLKITNAMEDYIEMIYRLNNKTNVNTLANSLNVKPSSVSKMAIRLKEINLINFEKYGQITLTEKGENLGKYLLWRHNTLKMFLQNLNKEEYSLEQVEKIEHFVDYVTVKNIYNLLKK